MIKIEHTAKLLKENNVGTVLTGELLAKHSTWNIGGLADVFVIPSDPQGISNAVQVAGDLSLPVVIIGGGSNLLFDDSGVRGIVIKIDAGLSHIEIENKRIRAGAGVWVPCLARAAGKAGLTGLEHIVGIPGTFGGLLFMNGGSQRKNIGECVREVRVMDRRGNQQTFSRQDCHFAYRKSVFQGKDFIILEAKLECQHADRTEIRREMLTILKSRSKKFPRKLPNCGSVFVSDPAIYESFGPPGKIIEDCMLKGAAIGDAEVSRQHANFIVNTGMATSAQVMKLIDMVRQKVHERKSCWLQCEVRYVSPAGEIKPVHNFL